MKWGNNFLNIHQDGSIRCLVAYIFNNRGTPNPSPFTTSSDSLQESFQFSEDGSMAGSSQTSLCRTSSSAENILRSPSCRGLWMETASNGGFAGNCATLTEWCDVLFTYFVLKCDCTFPDNFFVTGRFQVRFVRNKSEIALYCDLALIDKLRLVIWPSMVLLGPIYTVRLCRMRQRLTTGEFYQCASQRAMRAMRAKGRAMRAMAASHAGQEASHASHGCEPCEP